MIHHPRIGHTFAILIASATTTRTITAGMVARLMTVSAERVGNIDLPAAVMSQQAGVRRTLWLSALMRRRLRESELDV